MGGPGATRRAPPAAATVRASLLPAVAFLAGALAAGAVVAGEPAAGEPAADAPPSLTRALAGGEAAISLRYRFENVRDDAFAKPARASTLRTKLGYRSAPFRGLSLFLEAENVSEVGGEELFDNRGAGSLGNGIDDRPAVADPAATEVQQAYLRFERGATRLDLGRQEISLGDQRFVGPVGWRQNHQSFDALSLARSSVGSLESLSLGYTYLDRVHRIFGDSKPLDGHLLHATLRQGEVRLTLYGYYLDFERPADRALSTVTWGLELRGERAIGEAALLYEAEAALQEDAGENPSRVDAGYLHASAGLRRGRWSAKLGFERLEGAPGQGRFTTPLATLHKWNGWADKFLATPPAGLEDLYLEVAGKAGPWAWKGVYHDFSAESSGAEYGSESDLQLTYRTPWRQLFGLKAAFYCAEGFSTDTDKVWFWTAYTF